jgi:hypothetical protein
MEPGPKEPELPGLVQEPVLEPGPAAVLEPTHS